MISDSTRAFIAAHRLDDVRELALHARHDDDVDLPVALDQIAGWQTARTKLPSWADRDGVVYPPHLAMEQCSSEFTARYKASLAASIVAGIAQDDGDDGHGDGDVHAADSATAAGDAAGAAADRPASPAPTPAGGTLVDLTGGFGVDCSYMARRFRRAVYVERQPHLCALAACNLPALGLDHVEVVNADARAYLGSMPAADLIFLDPARRDDHGARTYAIADCSPDVTVMLDMLLARSPHVMVKLSPMLDWHKALDDCRGHVAQVHLVSTGNELKELLLVLGREICGDPLVVCVNDGQRLSFRAGDAAVHDPYRHASERPVSHRHGDAGTAPAPTHLFEPNASIMKAGCFALLEERFGVEAVGRDSHLFLAGHDVPDFPGRRFVIETVSTMNKRELRAAMSGLTHANIATRNFPMPVAALRRRLRLLDGGETYLFATTDRMGRHIVLRTVKAR